MRKKSKNTNTNTNKIQIKIKIKIKIKIPAEFRQCNLEELVRSISCGRCIDSLYIGLPENKTKHNIIRDNFNNITIIPPENM